MTGFFALLRLQLLSRYADLKPRNLKTQLKEKKARTIGTAIGVLVLIGYLAAILYIVESKMLDILIPMRMADLMVTLVVLLATVGTLVMAFFFVLSSLYLGRDAAVLAAMPLRSRTILSAKLTQVWVSETCIDALLILPTCILYGVRTGASAGFYLRLIPVWLLVSILPICIIAFLSSLLIRLSSLWKHRELLLTASGILLFVAYMILMMNLGGITGDATEGGEMLKNLLLSNTSRIETLTKYFPPAAWAAEGMLGLNYGMFAVWILISLAAPVLTVWLLGYGYRRLSMLQSETPEGTGKKRTGKESFTSASQLKACCVREFKSILRVPSYATNILPVSFMPLLMVVMICIIGGRAAGENGEVFKMLLRELDPTIVMGILTAVMAYMAGINPALSTAVSREGKAHDFLTALPVSAQTMVLAKLIVGFGLSAVGVVAAAVALLVFFPEFKLCILLATVLCLLFSYATAALALSRDVRKPKLDWVTEQEAVKQNFGVLISLLISWGILILLAGITYLFIRWNLDMLVVFAILAALLAGFSLGTTLILRKTTEKHYCEG